MEFTIEQLKLANELLFPADAIRLFKKHFPEFWMIYLTDLEMIYEGDLLRWIFSWSRADIERDGRVMGNTLDAMLLDILAVNTVVQREFIEVDGCQQEVK